MHQYHHHIMMTIVNPQKKHTTILTAIFGNLTFPSFTSYSVISHSHYVHFMDNLWFTPYITLYWINMYISVTNINFLLVSVFVYSWSIFFNNTFKRKRKVKLGSSLLNQVWKRKQCETVYGNKVPAYKQKMWNLLSCCIMCRAYIFVCCIIITIIIMKNTTTKIQYP